MGFKLSPRTIVMGFKIAKIMRRVKWASEMRPGDEMGFKIQPKVEVGFKKNRSRLQNAT